jgi:hypothetical protein
MTTKKTTTKRKANSSGRGRDVEQIKAKFVCGWAEYKPPAKEPITDAKGRLIKYDDKPGKIVTRLMVELDDGSCVPIHGDHFVPMTTEVKGALKAAFPGKFEETNKIAAEAYKPGATVKVKRTTFKDNGYVVYDEVE